jgi:hypothetical protein
MHETGSDAAVPAAFLTQLGGVFDAYLTIQQGLSHDQLHVAHAGSEQVLQALNAVDMTLLQGEGHTLWKRAAAAMRRSLSELGNAADIEAARQSFALLSTVLAQVADHFGTGGQESLYLYHCPMALADEGASWLQLASTAENPYLGSRMFDCGSKERSFAFKREE